MTLTPKYSVVIPVYNGEKTLRRCLDSLLSQGYKNVELILVNDGSTDASGAICREYAAANSNVICLEKVNGGVSSARNMGLDRASGEYLLFVDCDDYVSENYFAVLDTLVGTDFVQFSRCVVRENEKRSQRRNALFLEAPEAYFAFLSRGIYRKTLNALTDKIYRRKIVEENKNRFHPELSIGEDLLFNLSYCLCCKNCRVAGRVLYYVSTENPLSLSRKTRSDLQEQFALLDAEILQVIQKSNLEEKHCNQLLAGVNAKEVRNVYAHAKRMRIAGVDKKERMERIRHSCDSFASRKRVYPKSGFIRCLMLPVYGKWVRLIDMIGGRLAAGR